jgi:quercetin dioxygenase-like cupin family protein
MGEERIEEASMQKEELAKGKKIGLNGFIDYANEGIVSKTLLDKKTGSLTLFSFDRGQGLSEHTSPYDASVLILEGQARIRIGARSLTLGAGEMVIMPANVPHALKAMKPFKMLLIMIR